MKNYLIFLLTIQVTVFSSAFSQINDDFSDGNITDFPAWSGDISNFTVNNDVQLQLNAPAEAGQSYLSTASDIIYNAEWSFYLKLTFNPSSNNYIDIYLVSDQENLAEPLNGYFVRVGNTQDEISLYKQTGDKSTSTKIIDGVDDRVDVSIVECNIKVTRSIDGQWELLVDTGLSGSFISEGTTTDLDHSLSSHFGVFCKYTSTRSTKFFFDNLLITGDAYNDPDPPILDSLVVKSDSSLIAYFNEPLQVDNAINPDNYFVNNGIGNPDSVGLLNENTVSLFFSNKFENKVMNQISVHGVLDLFGNALNNYVTDFTYYAPYVLQFNDIIVTEIFADPTPEIDLPPYEFLELHNPTSETLSVKNLSLVVGSDTVPIPDFSINPGSYLILCQSAAFEQFQHFGASLKVSNWPTLNNRGERVSLYNSQGTLIFTIDYDDSWYQSIEKEEGGWSLEMIDTNFPCKGRENWKASEDDSGGTPGMENASKDNLADMLGPEISTIAAVSDHEILVSLNEKIAPVEIIPEQLSTNPELTAISDNLIFPDLNKINIAFSDQIIANTLYELTINNLKDCTGNNQPKATATFVLPSDADSLDVIINEILFNPWPDGVDFVELYNQSEKYLDLKDWKLGNSDTIPITLEHTILEPKEFLVLTEDFETLNNHYPGIDRDLVLEIERLTPFNDDEGEVRLLNGNDRSIDFFEYSEDFHSPFIKDPEGVSLERISFDNPTNSADNWQSASESVGFATPGRMNSQYFSSINKSDEITIEPKVFDPGNSGTNNFTLIKCRFDQPGNMASIKVLDASGREIKTIAAHQAIGTEENFKWEGENDQGEEVRMGYYIVYLEIYNATGSMKIYRKKVVVGGRM